MRTLVTGAGGFIGGHLVKRLVAQGVDVVGVDIKPLSEWWQVSDDAWNLDYTNVAELNRMKWVHFLEEIGDVYHLADVVGGIGYIQTHRVHCLESISITMELLRALTPGQHRVLFASSACVYNTTTQQTYALPDVTLGLVEDDAWPAQPEEGYGLSKLYAEKLCEWHYRERGLTTRVARFHNSYGPMGSWDDSFEKAPAALCRKVAMAKLTGQDSIEVWGTGQETRSFLYVTDNVTGCEKLLHYGSAYPTNLGSEETVTIDQLVSTIEHVAGGRPLRRVYQPEKPIGVAGRTSDNTLLRKVTDGWSPSTPLMDGIATTYEWIYDQVKAKYHL